MDVVPPPGPPDEASPAPPWEVARWGVVPYREAVARMEALARRVAAGEAPPRHLLLLEHPPVITLGLRARAAEDLRVSEAELVERGVEVATCDRGGRATLHAPGQLVAWFVARLAGGRRALPRFLAGVEAALVATLAAYGVAAAPSRADVGIWLEDAPAGPGGDPPARPRRKIASVGFRFHEGVTTHGVGLNVANDLAPFGLLVPCGLEGVAMARLRDELPSGHPAAGLGDAALVADVAARLAAAVAAHSDAAAPPAAPGSPASHPATTSPTAG